MGPKGEGGFVMVVGIADGVDVVDACVIGAESEGDCKDKMTWECKGAERDVGLRSGGKTQPCGRVEDNSGINNRGGTAVGVGGMIREDGRSVVGNHVEEVVE